MSIELGNKGTCVAVKLETRDYLHKESLAQSGRILTVGARFLLLEKRMMTMEREKNEPSAVGLELEVSM